MINRRYVLLKEKLAIQSDLYYHAQIKNGEVKELKTAIVKVKVSMARLLTVVNERNKLKNEFLQFLEFWFISIRKKNEVKKEEKALKKEYEREMKDNEKDNILLKSRRSKKLKIEKTKKSEDNSNSAESNKAKESLKDAYNKTKHDQLNKITLNTTENTIGETKEEGVETKEDTLETKREEVENNEEGAETKEVGVKTIKRNNKKFLENHIRILTKEEERMVESLERKYSSQSLLNTYFQNPEVLKGREKRKVLSKVNADRALNAKNIFMKEMAAISYSLKNSKQSENPEVNKLENLA